MQDAAGNLALRVFWRPTIVATNHYLHTTLWAGADLLGLAVTNFDDSVAQRYDPPWPTGLAVTAVDFVRSVPVTLPQCQAFSQDYLYCDSSANRAKCRR